MSLAAKVHEITTMPGPLVISYSGDPDSMTVSSISRGGRITAAVLLSAALAACTGDRGPAGEQGPPGQPGQPGGLDPSLSAADKAFLGMGGEEAITAITSFSIQAEGTRLVLSEGFDPEDGAVTASVFTNTTTYDLANDAFRIDWDRDYLYLPGALAYSEVVNGDLGYIKGSDLVFAPPNPDALAAMPSDRMAAVRREQRLLNPLLILRDVASTAAGATEGSPTLLDGVVHERLVVSDTVSNITLYINPRNGQISKLETRENDHLRRDVAIEVFYADWQASGDVLFPGAVFLTVDGEMLLAETRTFQANATVGDVAIPATVDPAPVFDQVAADRGMHSHQHMQQYVSLGVPTTGVQSNVVAVPLDNADPAQARVFHLTGGSHNSLAVRQADGVVIVEAPLYPERSQAIMEWVETQFGAGTRVTHVIATHHHFDHSSGLREFVAAGAQIVMHEESRRFFEGIFRAPSTIVPDTLAMMPGVEPKISTVADDGSFDLADANAPVGVYPMATTHAKDMVLVHVDIPGSEVVFVSDVFSPGTPPLGPGPGETLAAIVEHDLTVTTIAGGHGATATLQQLEDIVNPPVP
jgi:glyoxylase-like metal-dependent hydrolase (beta-lactamase superfamily II)